MIEDDNEYLKKDTPETTEDALKDISKQLRIQNIILKRIMMSVGRRR